MFTQSDIKADGQFYWKLVLPAEQKVEFMFRLQVSPGVEEVE
jgi:hypothetical protein